MAWQRSITEEKQNRAERRWPQQSAALFLSFQATSLLGVAMHTQDGPFSIPGPILNLLITQLDPAASEKPHLWPHGVLGWISRYNPIWKKQPQTSADTGQRGEKCVSRSLLWQNPDRNNSKRGKIYFGSRLHRLQSMISWPMAVRPVWGGNMAGAEETGSPHGSQEPERERDRDREQETRHWREFPRLGLHDPLSELGPTS